VSAWVRTSLANWLSNFAAAEMLRATNSSEPGERSADSEAPLTMEPIPPAFLAAGLFRRPALAKKQSAIPETIFPSRRNVAVTRDTYSVVKTTSTRQGAYGEVLVPKSR